MNVIVFIANITSYEFVFKLSHKSSPQLKNDISNYVPMLSSICVSVYITEFLSSITSSQQAILNI